MHANNCLDPPPPTPQPTHAQTPQPTDSVLIYRYDRRSFEISERLTRLNNKFL